MSEEKKTVKVKASDTGKRISIEETHKKKTTLRRKHSKEEPKEKVSEQKVETPKKEEPVKKEVIKPQINEAQQTPSKPLPKNVESVEFDESGDFEAMLLESESTKEGSDASISLGDKVSGEVVHIGSDLVFISLGPKLEAAMDKKEFLDENNNLTLSMGDKVTSFVVSTTGGVTLSNQSSYAKLDKSLLTDAYAQKMPIEGKVLSDNKGGFDVSIAGQHAFCPISQIDKEYVTDPKKYLNKSLPFLIQRIDEGGRNVVVSHRAVLENRAFENALELIDKIEVDKEFDGIVTRVADSYAIVDIGGIEGIIPRSEISYGHIDKVSDLLSPKDPVKVQVINFEKNSDDPTKSKLTLSLKKTKEDPYALHWHKIKPGATLEGKVVRLENFGAFVELFEGIDGLIHISELSEARVSHPREVLNINDPVTVRVLLVDEENKRISLSLRESVSRKKGTSEPAPIKRGDKVSGTVARIERYGLFLELNEGVTALLPHSEAGIAKHTDLHKKFSIGDQLEAMVIDVDERNRVKVSLTALEKLEEEDSYLAFQTKQKKSSSFGTFADLLKKK